MPMKFSFLKLRDCFWEILAFIDLKTLAEFETVSVLFRTIISTLWRRYERWGQTVAPITIHLLSLPPLTAGSLTFIIHYFDNV
jgi:hypothetical protein